MAPRVQVDVAELERLYLEEGLTREQVGERLGVSPQTVGRRLRERGHELRAPGRPEKYEPVKIGTCGTPGCTDPDCPPSMYGVCHCRPRYSERCWRPTPIAAKHDRRRHYVKGMHTMFAHGHDRLSENGRAAQREAMAAKRDDAKFNARWGLVRHNTTKLFGYLGGPKGLDEVERDDILDRHRSGQSQRQIALYTGRDRKTVRRVLAAQGG